MDTKNHIHIVNIEKNKTIENLRIYEEELIAAVCHPKGIFNGVLMMMIKRFVIIYNNKKRI